MRKTVLEQQHFEPLHVITPSYHFFYNLPFSHIKYGSMHEFQPQSSFLLPYWVTTALVVEKKALSQMVSKERLILLISGRCLLQGRHSYLFIYRSALGSGTRHSEPTVPMLSRKSLPEVFKCRLQSLGLRN